MSGKRSYLLSVRFRFPAVDDVAARMIARGVKAALAGAWGLSDDINFNLQQIHPNKAPRKVNL